MQFREHQSHISSIKMLFNHRTNEKRNMNPSHNSLKIRMPINHLFLINLTFLRQQFVTWNMIVYSFDVNRIYAFTGMKTNGNTCIETAVFFYIHYWITYHQFWRVTTGHFAFRNSLKNITSWHFFSLSSNCCNIIEITLREHRNSCCIFCVVMHSYIKRYFFNSFAIFIYVHIYYLLSYNSVLNVYISWLK